MFTNFENQTIVITKKENEEAKKNGEALEAIKKAMQDFPGFTVVVANERSKRKSFIDRIDFDYMEAYILAHSDNERLNEFYAMRGLNESGEKLEGHQSLPFMDIKNWFLDVYEEFRKADEEFKALKNARKAATTNRKRDAEVERLKMMIARVKSEENIQAEA